MNEEFRIKKWWEPALRLLSFLVVTVVLLSVSCATHVVVAPAGKSEVTPLQWSQRLADSEMARSTAAPRWDYAAGLFAWSLLQLNAATRDPRYEIYAEDAIGPLIAPDGTIRGYHMDEYQLDALMPGRAVLALGRITHDDKYNNAAAILRRQLDTQPRTPDGGFWHKQRYTNQMWLDGVYMAEPFYAEYAKLGDPSGASFDDIAKQIELIDEHTYDPRTGLNYHAWDAARVQPWANPVTGCSSNFWARGEGWYAMALVDLLDDFPPDHPARAQILTILQKTMAGIARWQDRKTGLWWQVMNQGGRPGNYREATASAMFVYALAKSVNRGYLPAGYAKVARKGFAGIVKYLITDDGNGQWSLANCCSVAGLGFKNAAGRPRDGSFGYYVSEPVVKNDLKGVGPFILAGIEVQKLTGTSTKVQ